MRIVIFQILISVEGILLCLQFLKTILKTGFCIELKITIKIFNIYDQ